MRRDEDIHELEEEREEEEHQEEQYNEETPIEKLKKIMSRNKKYLIGGVVVVFGLVVLLMPKKGDKCSGQAKWEHYDPKKLNLA